MASQRRSPPSVWATWRASENGKHKQPAIRSKVAEERDKPLSFHWKLLDPTWLDNLSLPAARSNKETAARASVLIEALIVARAEPTRWISYSRRRGFYARQQRYFGTAYTFATVPPVIDQLAFCGFLEHDKKPPGSMGWQSRFRASRALIATFDQPLPVLFDPIETIRLKNENGHLVDYRDTAATDKMRRNLETINEALRAALIELDAPGAVSDGQIIRCGDQVLYKQMQLLWRVFNSRRFALGGRFYGGWWQTAKSADRAHIMLDGEPTIEHDYEQLHPRLLYANAGKHLDGDAYTLDGWHRPLVKKAFNILLNAETYLAALRALTNEIGGAGAQAKAAALIEAVKARHADVADYFHSGIGLNLQRKDADIAEQVMLDLLRDGIIALPIHDSFIGKASYGDRIKDIMEDVLYSAFPSLKPITYKESVPHMAGLACLVMPFPRQGDLFPSPVSVPVSDLAWTQGRVPLSVCRAVRHELRRQEIRQDDLARRIGISRSQLTNALNGRFGLGPAAAGRLKAFVVEVAEEAAQTL